MAKKGNIYIRMKSTKSSHYYVTKKNPRTATEKFSETSYDPIVREHVEYKEAKMPPHSKG